MVLENITKPRQTGNNTCCFFKFTCYYEVYRHSNEIGRFISPGWVLTRAVFHLGLKEAV